MTKRRSKSRRSYSRNNSSNPIEVVIGVIVVIFLISALGPQIAEGIFGQALADAWNFLKFIFKVLIFFGVVSLGIYLWNKFRKKSERTYY